MHLLSIFLHFVGREYDADGIHFLKPIAYGIHLCNLSISKPNSVSVMSVALQCGMVGASWSVFDGAN